MCFISTPPAPPVIEAAPVETLNEVAERIKKLKKLKPSLATGGTSLRIPTGRDEGGGGSMGTGGGGNGGGGYA